MKMSQLVLVMVAVSAVAAAAAGGAVPAAMAVPAAGPPAAMTGLGALSARGPAEVSSVSCASAGNCAAGGSYTDTHHKGQGFVAGQNNGRWGKATGLPGLAALNTGGNAGVSSVSCASAGSCTASGYYVSRDGDWRVFAAGERHGRWSPATEVAGVTALSPDRYVQVTSLSCAPAGNCAAGGSYIARNDTGQGFVAVEKNGRWGKTTGVPGLAALNAGGAAQVSSVSCAAAGSCAAGGYYWTNSGQRAFVADERDGRWGKATALPGLAALDTDELSEVTSVSCSSAGSCAAGGDYLSILHGSQPFVAGERHGRWGKAIQLPGLAALNDGGAGEVTSVSCASPGNCTAGGYLGDRGGLQGFVAGERHGRWGTAILIPGLAALNKAGAAEVTSVSCSSAGNCAAGGFVAVSYADGDDLDQGFVATERHGSWSKAIEVPGLAALNTDKDAQVWSVSCAPAGNCAAGGSYTDRHGQDQGFVASERHGLWSIAIKIPR
jgi:hypothetical protein